MWPRIRHRLPGIHLTVGENLGKNLTQAGIEPAPKRNFRPAGKRLNRLSYAGGQHNTVRSLIAASIRQNASYEVYEEIGCVSSDGSTRRANIIIIDRQKDKGVILDPTIRFEMHEQQPQEVCREKQVIYEPCCQHLGAQYHITHWTVFGLMFGARGTIPRSTSFKIAMALRLGCKLCQPHQCICVGIADIYGYHALSCARSKGRIPRHTSLNDIIKRSLTSCGIPSLLEPPGISRADGKRPDGLTLIPWSRGKSLIWDSTCVDTLAPSHLPNTSRRAASAAELAVKKKVNKYAHLLDNYIFVPFAVETFGPWSHDAKVLVSQIGQILISITGDRRCTTYLRQRLSIAIQLGNAMSVLGTLPESSPLDELFLL
ncbi:hypothetical protein ANN_16797 [Periplaneta americana]|uniref:Uncharacterized protein n=1 Tax=Periplaneta americana TaxID=6978 RepID=A0ABQ8SSG5_PERAM|nr:hypothetical protein ANN_16797 [Periplaneta americana]